MADLSASGRKDGRSMRIKKDVHNAILIIISIIAGIMYFIFACCTEANPTFALIGCLICAAWLIPFTYANKDIL